MSRFFLSTSMLMLVLGCGDGDSNDDMCDASADADADGLNDCAEEEAGTDPSNPDSDGDGLTDAQEVDCVSNPLDADEQCYACGWEHNDPGTLTSDGSDFGDTMENAQLIDQCGEMVDLWDFAGEYHIMYLTAAW